MNQMGGEKPLRHLFQPVKWAGFDVHVGTAWKRPISRATYNDLKD